MARKPTNPDANYFKQMLAAEKSILSFTMEHVSTIADAARILGLTESYLYKRLVKVGLRDPEKHRRIKKTKNVKFPVKVEEKREPISTPNPVTIARLLQEPNEA